MHATNGMDGLTIRRRRIGLTVLAEARLRDELRRRSPSEPWVEAQFVSVSETDEHGHPIVRRIHDTSVFPPGGARTAMVRCRVCGIFTPPPAMEEGMCLDHSDSDIWGPSPSAAAIRALQYRNLRLPKMELLPDSAEALLMEISEYESGKGVKDSPGE